MSASSVDYFPCRVQLMGLSRSSSLAESISRSLGESTHPQVVKIQSISRNLFGTPDPAEMSCFYKQEAERQRSYILQRYNFHTKALTSTNEQEMQHTDKIPTKQRTINHIHATKFPMLIEDELKTHEQRLQNQDQYFNRSYLDLTPSNNKISSNTDGTLCEYSLQPCRTLGRQKPYKKKIVIESLRKGRGTTNGKSCNTERAHFNCCQSYQCSCETSRLYCSTNLKQSKCDLRDRIKKMSTYKEVNYQEVDKSSTNRTAISCNDKCTQFSLQLVASTRNVS